MFTIMCGTENVQMDVHPLTMFVFGAVDVLHFLAKFVLIKVIKGETYSLLEKGTNMVDQYLYA